MAEYKIMNFNQSIRKQIFDVVEKNLLVGISTKEGIDKIMDYIYSLEDTNEKSIGVYREFFMGVVYLDAYKMYAYKIKQGIASEEDIDTFYQLYNIIDFNDLYAEISANIGLFNTMIKAAYDFYNLNGLGKILVVRSLSLSENKKLSEIFPCHNLDLDTYYEPVTIDKLIKNIRSQYKFYERTLMIDFPEGIISTVVGFIKNLYMVDKNNAKDLCLQLALVDYRASKYLCDLVEDNKTLKEHVDLYEKNSLERIIDLLFQDSELLFDVIYMLVDLYVNGKYNDIDLSEQVINSAGDEEVLKKLMPKPKKDKE